jgi:hypothetical protein
MMDLAVAPEAAAGMLAAGGIKGPGEAAGGGLAAGVFDRGRKAFGSDARSADALERVLGREVCAVTDPGCRHQYS